MPSTSAAATPRHDHADERAQHKRDDGGHAGETERPRQGGEDDVRHGVRKVADREAELKMRDVPEIVEVLTPERLMGAQPEGDLERIEGGRVQMPLVARHHRLGGVARHHPRQHEVEGDGRPERDDEELEPA